MTRHEHDTQLGVTTMTVPHQNLASPDNHKKKNSTEIHADFTQACSP